MDEIDISQLRPKPAIEHTYPGYPCGACRRRKNKSGCMCGDWYNWYKLALTAMYRQYRERRYGQTENDDENGT